MIILLPLLAKLNLRSRVIVGRGLVVLGVLALVIGVLAVPAIVVEAAVTVLVGGVFLVSAWSTRRGRARAAQA